VEIGQGGLRKQEVLSVEVIVRHGLSSVCFGGTVAQWRWCPSIKSEGLGRQGWAADTHSAACSMRRAMPYAEACLLLSSIDAGSGVRFLESPLPIAKHTLFEMSPSVLVSRSLR
jgi:hypothetical protein